MNKRTEVMGLCAHSDVYRFQMMFVEFELLPLAMMKG